MYTEYGFTIPENETITFKVSGNPTTGYEWNHLEDEAFDVERDYYQDEVKPWQRGYTGIGGTYYFTLSANEGAEQGDKGVFSIAYSRSWEDRNVDSYTYPIHIG